MENSDKLVDAASKTLESLNKTAEKLTDIAPGMWDTMVRQQYIDGVTWCVYSGLLVCLSVLFVCLTNWRFKKAGWFEKEDPNDPTSAFFLGILTAVVWILTIVMLLAVLPESIQQILNPEYFALKDLFYSLR